MGNRTMYDSTDLSAIPGSAEMVASYLTGFPQTAAQWARFKGKTEVTIVQHSGVYDEGDVLDIERGAAGTGDAFRFIDTRRKAGYGRPSIYCSLSTVSAVRAATGKFVLGTHYDLWVASWTGTPHNAYPGSVATQYRSLQSYDISVVYDAAWPHRTASAPKPSMVRRLSDGTESLEELLTKQGTTSWAEATELTLAHATEAEKHAYITYVFGGAARVMPHGTVYYTK